VGDRGLPARVSSLGAVAAGGGRASGPGPTASDGSLPQGPEPGKSDEIDALAVARAVVNDGVEEFAVAFLDERSMEIRLLLDHRSDLAAERTRAINRLRWHLLELCPELEASLKRGALNKTTGLDRVDRRLRKLPGGARVRIAREHSRNSVHSTASSMRWCASFTSSSPQTDRRCWPSKAAGR
jgi:hypothetical protein